MRRIRGCCGRQIEEAAGGDRRRAALLAALAANESGGSRLAFRFVAENHQRLAALLAGGDSVEGVTRAALEKRLKQASAERERAELLKRLAGVHGYTGIPGYLAMVWKVPLETLVDRGRHFELAGRRLEGLCREFGLDPASQAAEIGRAWNAGHPNGRTRSALYSWRLEQRMRLYLQESWEGVDVG